MIIDVVQRELLELKLLLKEDLSEPLPVEFLITTVIEQNSIFLNKKQF